MTVFAVGFALVAVCLLMLAGIWPVRVHYPKAAGRLLGFVMVGVILMIASLVTLAWKHMP